MTRDPESVYRSTPETPLFAYARKTDRATSHEAAKSVVNLGATRERILAIIRECGPSTDEQIADWYTRMGSIPHLFRKYPPISPSGLRSRRSELVRLNLVEACGEGRTASGRKCTIWRLKSPRGRDAVVR